MTSSDVDKNPASKNAPKPRKPDAELRENELEEISGGFTFPNPVSPVSPHHKTPNKIQQFP